MGTPWPGLLTCMGWGSIPSWLQRAARGRPKRAPLAPEPDGPGTSAAAEFPRRANGQGSPLLLLRVSPAAKGKRAKSRGGEAVGKRSRTLSGLSPHCRAHGRVMVWERGAPGLISLLPQSHGDGCALQEGQQQPQRSTSARLPEQERRAVLSPPSPNSPAAWPRPPSLPEGTGGGRCSAPACKEHAALSEQPRSRKGPRRAASAPGCAGEVGTAEPAARPVLTFAWAVTSLSRLLACSVVAWAGEKSRR